MIWVLWLSLRALARGKRLLIVALLLAVPALLTLGYAASEAQPDGERFAVDLFNSLILPVMMPLAAALFATSALGSEIEDRTLIYLTLRPVSRLGLVLGKFIAAAAVCVVLIEVALTVMYAIAAQRTSGAPPAIPGDAAGDHVLWALLLAGLAGSLAYGGVFLLLGLLAPRRGLLIAFIYVLAWEGTAAGLSGALATFSVRRYVQGILNATLDDTRLAALAPSTLSGYASLLVLAGLLIAAIAGTTYRLKSLELP